MSLDSRHQYATDENLRARQRLWEQQHPRFDLVSWVLDLADVSPGLWQQVLDVGCGNGLYLRELRHRGVAAVGADLSFGMLGAARPHPLLVNADVTELPFREAVFDVVLSPHMLYHVDDREAAAREMRRVLKPGGVCVAVTNGRGHMQALRSLVEEAVRQATPGWEMHNPSTHVFSLENGAAQLRVAFAAVTSIRPDDVASVRITDPQIAADYVASVADYYQHETRLPWDEVVAHVRQRVASEIAANGSFAVAADVGAFVCR